jgi:hypothetical protein
MSQKVSSVQDRKLEDTLVSFAFVCHGTLEQFEDIKSYIMRMSGARLIYQKTSIEHLRICTEKVDQNGPVKST